MPQSLLHWRALAPGKLLEIPIKFDQAVAPEAAVFQAVPQSLWNIAHNVVGARGRCHRDGSGRVDVAAEVDAVDQEIGHGMVAHKRCDGGTDAVAPLGADRSFVRTGPTVSGHMCVEEIGEVPTCSETVQQIVHY